MEWGHWLWFRTKNKFLLHSRKCHIQSILVYIISFVPYSRIYNGIIQQGIHLSYGTTHFEQKLSIKTSTPRIWLLCFLHSSPPLRPRLLPRLIALIAHYLSFKFAIQIKRQCQRKQILCTFCIYEALQFCLISFIRSARTRHKNSHWNFICSIFVFICIIIAYLRVIFFLLWN